jgi:hypothetical protein
VVADAVKYGAVKSIISGYFPLRGFVEEEYECGRLADDDQFLRHLQR